MMLEGKESSRQVAEANLNWPDAEFDVTLLTINGWRNERQEKEMQYVCIFMCVWDLEKGGGGAALSDHFDLFLHRCCYGRVAERNLWTHMWGKADRKGLILYLAGLMTLC